MRFISLIAVGLSLGVFACGENGEADDATSPASESEVVAGDSDSKDAKTSKTPTLGIEVRQGDKSASVTRATEGKVNVAKVAMKAGSFVLRFPKQKDGVAIQITAWTDASIFDAVIGESSQTHQSFGDATGIAGSGDGTLYLDDRGNNYLVGDRLVSDSDKTNRVSFAKTFLDGASTPLTEQKGDLFLAVYIDKNQDRRFDAGEVEYLVLSY